MVSYTCPVCDGSGKERVTIIKNSGVKQGYDQCWSCLGSGSMRNGRPEVDFCEPGITDPDPMWKNKYGDDYDELLELGAMQKRKEGVTYYYG